MSHYDGIRADLIDILNGPGPDATSLYAVGVPMVGKGFNQGRDPQRPDGLGP